MGQGRLEWFFGTCTKVREQGPQNKSKIDIYRKLYLSSLSSLSPFQGQGRREKHFGMFSVSGCLVNFTEGVYMQEKKRAT